MLVCAVPVRLQRVLHYDDNTYGMNTVHGLELLRWLYYTGCGLITVAFCG